MMDGGNTYYNLIPPKAKSEDIAETEAEDDDSGNGLTTSEPPPGSPSAGSDDSGVPTEEESRPQRPPRSIDQPLKLVEHSYINLPAAPPTPPPPTLPKRQPYMVNPRSPALPTRAVVYNNETSGARSNSVAPATSTASSASQRSNSFSSARSSRRRGACKCKTPGEMNTGEEDVILVYSRFCPGAVEWAKYLHRLYTELSKQKDRLRVRHLPVEDMGDRLKPLPPHMEDEICSSRLQLVLLSPTLLQFLYRQPSLLVGRLLHPDRVIAIMLGVRDGQIQAEHRRSLVSFSQWIHLEAKDHDLEFVQTVLYFSTQILQRSTHKTQMPSIVRKTSGRSQSHERQLVKQQQQNELKLNTYSLARSASNSQNHHGHRSTTESNLFHLHPRVVSEDHNRILVIFESPQQSRAKIRITLERNQAGLNDVDLDEMKLLNPYNLLVTIPNCCFSVCNLAAIRVEIDGCNRGCRSVRLESSLSVIDNILKMSTDPVEFMCQAVGVNPVCKDQLDEALTKQFLLNTPKRGFHLLNGQTLILSNLEAMPKDSGEFPTLLHFSACHGLERLSSVLMDCPGAADAIQMRNVADMTPSELAHVNGHFDLANRLHNFHVTLYKESSNNHVYDYIHQNQNSPQLRHQCRGGSNLKNNCASTPLALNYQIPPPPRPVHIFKHVPAKNNVNVNSMNTVGAKSKEEPARLQPRPNLMASSDPYGTLRASKRLAKNEVSKQTNNNSQEEEEVGDDDVFLDLPAPQPSINSRTLPANPGTGSQQQRKTMPVDYRGVPGLEKTKGGNDANSDLAITNELLQLLDDLQNKKYAAKEVELLFDNWRRKAAFAEEGNKKNNNTSSKEDLESLKEKVRRHKATSALMKFFKSSNNNNTTSSSSNDNPPAVEASNIKHTKNTRTFRKPSLEEVKPKPTPLPMPGNETIIEGEITIFDENEMSVVALPNTPEKCRVSPREGVSTQILPLSRLSMSSSNHSSANSPPDPNPKETSPNATPLSRPVAEVQPFSPDSLMSSSTEERSKTSPVREKFDKIRRSLTEPLIQYFHDLQSSPDNEEPEVLNTPKSVTAPTSSKIPIEESKIRSRSLFKEDENETETEPNNDDINNAKDENEHNYCAPQTKPLAPPIVTDM